MSIFFDVQEVSFSYNSYGEVPVEIPALENVSAKIEKGDFNNAVEFHNHIWKILDS